jgi:hypothetical protein
VTELLRIALAASQANLLKALRSLYESGLWLILLAWMVMFSWHPAVLGFYYDDWGVMVEGVHHGPPFSAEMFQWFLSNNIDRPMQGITHYVFTSLFGDSVLAWHWMQSLSVLLFAILYFYFLKAVFRLFHLETATSGGRWIPAIVASLWFLVPWITGWSLWTCTSGFLFTSLFILACERILTPWSRGEAPGWIPAALYFFLGFYYEQYYFQFFFLFLMGCFAGVPQKIGYKSMLITMLQFLLAQSFPLVWNRLHSHRGMVSNTMSLFVSNLLTLPAQLYNSFGKMKIPLAIISTVGMGTLIAISVKTLKRYPAEQRLPLLGLIGVCLLGAIYGIFFYSVGGYTIISTGTGSRTMIGFTLWLLVLVALGLHFLRTLSLPLKKILLANLLLVLPMLAVANIQQTLVWRDKWHLENKIIQSFPSDQLANRLSSDAVFIYDGPYKGDGLSFFGSTWAISGAINNHFPEIKVRQHISAGSKDLNQYSVRGWHPFLLCGKGISDWDGQRLMQAMRTENLSLPTRQVWLWQVEQKKLTLLQSPQHLQCHPERIHKDLERNVHAR